jgi:hypothetical protein
MKRMHWWWPICALAAPMSALAAGGTFEINQDCAAAGCFAGDTAGFPITITQSGTYVLTSDLVVNGGTDGIDITAAEVDLDLNGHSMSGGGSCTGAPVSACTGANSSDGIAFNGSASGHIRVHNGTVRGFGNYGIEGYESGNGIRLENLTLAENSAYGTYLGTGSYTSVVQVRNSSFVRNNQGGLLSQISVNVEKCMFSGNKFLGLDVNNNTAVIANSRFENNGAEGMKSLTMSTTLDHNAFLHNNGGAAQWNIATLLDMGGNVCADHACP